MTRKISVLDVKIDNVSMSEAVAIVKSFIKDGSAHMIATANAEMVMLAQQDKELFTILNNAHLVVPDGAGVVWAARYLGTALQERVAGFDLTQELLAEAATEGYRIYMFGGAPGVAEAAKADACRRFPGIQIVGIHDGYFTAEQETQIIKDIVDARPHILLTALGVPKQEKWLAKNMHKLGIPVAIGVGGTLDVMAGTMLRAPLWMQKANLEWFFRLVVQPKRAIRMLALPKFVIEVVTWKNN